MPLFVESFDSYNGLGTGTGLLGRWYNTNAAQSVRQSLVAGRFGVGQAYNAGAGSGATIHQTNCLIESASGVGFSVETGFSMHAALAVKDANALVANGSEVGFCLSNSSDIPQLGLRYNANCWSLVRWGAVAGGSPAAILWTSSPIYGDLTFRSFKMKGVIHASIGSVDLMIDGTQVYSASGINTGTGTINRVAFCQGDLSFNAGIVCDDLVIKDSAAAYLPDLRIDQLPPVGDGATLNLTPSTGTNHFAVVDESQVSTADYLSGTNVGDFDLLDLANMSTAPNQILGVNLIGYANKTDVTARAWNLGCKSGATTSNGSDLSLATSAGYYHRLLETDPNTAAEWLKSNVDALQIQPRIAV